MPRVLGVLWHLVLSPKACGISRVLPIWMVIFDCCTSLRPILPTASVDRRRVVRNCLKRSLSVNFTSSRCRKHRGVMPKGPKPTRSKPTCPATERLATRTKICACEAATPGSADWTFRKARRQSDRAVQILSTHMSDQLATPCKNEYNKNQGDEEIACIDVPV